MAKNFAQKHGYQEGTYERKLGSSGYNVGELMASGDYGKNINPSEYSKITNTIKNPYQVQQEGLSREIGSINQGFQDLASNKFEFDPNKYLPGIQETASSIYDPQKAILEANSALQKSQLQDVKVTTNKQFDKRMQQEVEAINKRGSHFSGGAIQNEQDIRDQQTRSLFQLDQTGLAAEAQILAQKGMLSAQQTQYVQDQLMNSKSSAYQQFLGERGFKFDVLSKRHETTTGERNFLRGSFESDRSFSESQRQFDINYDMDVEQLELAKDKFKFDQEKYGEQFAFDAFKYANSQAKASKKKSGSGGGSRYFTKADQKATIVDLVNSGKSWDETADLLAGAGVPIEQGTYADQALNTIFNLEYTEALKSGYSGLREDYGQTWSGDAVQDAQIDSDSSNGRSL